MNIPSLFTTLTLLITLQLPCLAEQTTISQDIAHQLIMAAKAQIDKTTCYNPAYQKMAYPGGDVNIEEGVCTDVIIRAFRNLGMDLQVLVHEDMTKNWKAYPGQWGLKSTDTHIDHRRVPNLMTFFNHKKLKVKDGEFKPGDIVVWDLGKGIRHIGILSDKRTILTNHCLVVHNICCGVREEDVLKEYPVVGHYRLTYSL